jgi:hypothetical protein
LAERGLVTKMGKWVTFLNRFLELSNYPILQDQSKVTALEARLKAEGEYDPSHLINLHLLAKRSRLLKRARRSKAAQGSAPIPGALRTPALQHSPFI